MQVLSGEGKAIKGGTMRKVLLLAALAMVEPLLFAFVALSNLPALVPLPADGTEATGEEAWNL